MLMDKATLLLVVFKSIFLTCLSTRDSGVAECESGWELFRGKCYLDSSSSEPFEKAREKNYSDSRSECLFRNSVLLSLQLEEEEAYLQHILDNKQKQNYFTIHKYWLHGEQNKGQIIINQESRENCNSLSMDVNSLKYFKTHEENCSSKYNYICKKNAASSNDAVDGCDSCDNKKKRSTRKDMNLYMNIVPNNPSWNSPFGTAFKAPFWDDYGTHSSPKYLYQHPLDHLTFQNVRKRLKIEAPKKNLNSLLPILQQSRNTPSSKNIYNIDTPKLSESPKSKLKKLLQGPSLKIENNHEDPSPLIKQYVYVKGCKEDDIQRNGSCYHFQLPLSFEEATNSCLKMYNGTLSQHPEMPPSFEEQFQRFFHTLGGREFCNHTMRSVPNAPCFHLLPSICKYEMVEKEVEYDPSLHNETEVLCPEGWHLKAEKCYKLVTENKSWEEATSFCDKSNATILNSIQWDNETYFDFIFATPKYAAYDHLKVWIASNQSLGSCYGVDLSVLKNSQKTVQRFKGVCWQQQFFICQKSNEFKLGGVPDIRGKLRMPLDGSVNNQAVTVHQTTIKTPVEGICKEWLFEVWFRFGDYCYLFYSFIKSRPTSWGEAQQICKTKNAFLASIHSKEENYWIYGKVHTFQDDFLWIGGKYDGRKTFLWDDGTPFDYIQWAHGEPNNLNDVEECLALRTHDGNGEWNDDHCFERAGYICKMLHPEAVTSVMPTNISLSTTATLPTSIANESTIQVKKEETTTSTKSIKPITTTLASVRTIKGTSISVTTTTPTATTTTTTTSTTSTTTTPTTKKSSSSLPKSETSRPSDNVRANYSKIIFPSAFPSTKRNETSGGGCPDSWYRMENKCVKFYSMLHMSYTDARDVCYSLDKKFRASLVSIHSEKELAFLFALMTSYTNSWIGLRYSSTREAFIWEDRTAVDFVPWAKNEPTMTSIATPERWFTFTGCVQIIINGDEVGFWRDVDCSREEKTFFCQMPLDPEYEKSLLPFPKKCSGLYKDFYSFGDNCYKFIEAPLTWQEAEENCIAEGAHLVTIRNRKEMSYLWNQFSVMNSLDFWIGLKTPPAFFNLLQFTHKWVSGWFIFYTNWQSEKEFDNFKACTSMRASSGKWLLNECSDKKPSICEYSIQAQLPSINSTNVNRCPAREGWIDFSGDYCYKIKHSKPLSWPEASHYCLRKKGHLVSINSKEEQQNIQNIVDGAQMSIWIGATGVHKSGNTKDLSNFVWSDSSEFSFENWYNKAGIFVSSEECVQMMSIGGYWSIDECSSRKAFICKALKSNLNPQKNYLYTIDNSAAAKGLTQSPQNDPQDEKSSEGIGGIAIGGILIFILVVIGSGFLAGFFLIKKWQVQKNAPPTTFYGFDNVIYNAETITVAGQQIECAPEERECILEDDDEDSENPKYSLTGSKSFENIFLPNH